MIDNKLEIPIMIDYAHSPESLESIFKAVKHIQEEEVICVFGWQVVIAIKIKDL